MSNCGLDALKRMTALNKVSMFTLIHLAKDNGINLYFCKVNEDELLLVKRPAIFHQKDHFVFSENGDPMPSGTYTGYVLTERAIHEPLPFTLAKKITGGKKAAQILAPIVTGIASIVGGPIAGAVVGAGMGAVAGSSMSGGLGKNWWAIPLGGATGYLGGMAPGSTVFGMPTQMAGGLLGAAGGLAAGGGLGGAVLGGLAGYTGTGFAQGARAGFQNAMGTGSSLWDSTKAGWEGGVKNMWGGGGTTSSSAPGMATAQTGAGGGTTASAPYSSLASSFGQKSLASMPAVTTVPSAAQLAGSTVTGTSGMLPFSATLGPATAAQTASGGTASLWDKSKNMLGGIVKDIGAKQILGGALGAAVPEPTNYINPNEALSRAQQYYQNEWGTLPEATRTQLESYVNKPISELTQEFMTTDDRGQRLINQKFDDARVALMRQYQEAGQDPMTSSDAAYRLQQLEQQRVTALSENTEALQKDALQKAIDIKKDVFSKSVEQQKADYTVLMDLASTYGYEQYLKTAMSQNDTNALRQIIAQIFQTPYPYQQQQQQTSATFMNANA